MAKDFGFWLKKVSDENAASLDAQASGESGYFSTPVEGLDPHLFNGKKLKPEIRSFVKNTLVGWFNNNTGFKKANSWLHIWIAGSGITYQWSASRGNGDLDVLFGVDWVKFRQANPDDTGGFLASEDDMAALVNTMLKNSLWPKTAETDLNGQIYEVTFYWNPGTGTDIKNIHPYAAYSINKNTWTVNPPKLPTNPAKRFPVTWGGEATQDMDVANRLITQYKSSLNKLNAAVEGSAGWNTATSELRLVADQAKALFDEIHLGRKAAFQEGGNGFEDWHNYRWQAAKQSGAMQTLHALSTIDVTAKQERDKSLYGQTIADAQTSLTRAIMWNSGRWNG